MAPEPEDDEFDYFPECCFFGADFVQIGLAASKIFIGMVTCFQIKQ